MKTSEPLIVTAQILEQDLQPFDTLRKQYFPADKNFLRAHVTLFHRLPGEYIGEVQHRLTQVASEHSAIRAEIVGLRHLGAGVAFTISSDQLQQVHASLKLLFRPWLGGQDMQKWQPHITVQNKVAKPAADALYKDLDQSFQKSSLCVTGLDLWRYLGGPWQHCLSVPFTTSP